MQRMHHASACLFLVPGLGELANTTHKVSKGDEGAVAGEIMTRLWLADALWVGVPFTARPNLARPPTNSQENQPLSNSSTFGTAFRYTSFFWLQLLGGEWYFAN
jgi:hypothetical protein